MTALPHTASFPRRLTGTLRDNRAAWAFGVLLVTWIAAVLFAKGFDSVSSVRYLVQTAAFLGIVAVGQTLVVMMSGIDLSVSGVVALSAVVCAQVAAGSGGTTGIVVALAASVVVGLANAAGVTWLRVPPMVMTLATGTIVAGSLLVYTNGSPKSAKVSLLGSLANDRVAGVPLAFLLWLGITAVAVWLLHASRIGRYVFALGNGERASRASGVPLARTSFIAYGACSLLAGVSGLVLLGFTSTSSLTMGNPYQLLSIAAVVLGGTSILGGRGHVLGTVAGALMLTLLTALLASWNVSEGVRQIVLGLLIIGLLLAYARERRT
ncbi:monosaccharide ABC transporter membrane protein (CUT2 family) [Actinomadura pelletieri DSM 43383]|uniref:Monosaccharide ABC transporter membrane protein (CUT2 family) n=1 Tax=Actinomadura pelletieri DSM 43383 TaxID=1120940 RepID=A0A495QZY9_9ACTN|nr:ABC transporter permease [Actinomadura pelletieri]RKS79524.1 monosaccharide ABC transporter membrane protein (CUT2 family) [Actinomadura pelletieri DSM 43383]